MLWTSIHRPINLKGIFFFFTCPSHTKELLTSLWTYYGSIWFLNYVTNLIMSIITFSYLCYTSHSRDDLSKGRWIIRLCQRSNTPHTKHSLQSFLFGPNSMAMLICFKFVSKFVIYIIIVSQVAPFKTLHLILSTESTLKWEHQILY